MAKPKPKPKPNRSVRRKKNRTVKRNKQKKQAVKNQKRNRTSNKNRHSVNRKHKRNTIRNKLKKGGFGSNVVPDKAAKQPPVVNKKNHNEKTKKVIELIKGYELFKDINLEGDRPIKDNLDIVFKYISQNENTEYKYLKKAFQYTGNNNGIKKEMGKIIKTDDLYESLNKLFSDSKSDNCNKFCKITKHIPNYILHAYFKVFKKGKSNSYTDSKTIESLDDSIKANVKTFITNLNKASFEESVSRFLNGTDKTNAQDQKRMLEQPSENDPFSKPFKNNNIQK